MKPTLVATSSADYRDLVPRLTKFKARTVDRDLAAAMLHQIEQQYQYNSKLAVAGGILISLVSPMLLAFFFYVFAIGLFADHGLFVAYLIVAVVTLPLLFLLAHKLKGGLLDATVENTGVFDNWWTARQVGPALVVVEMAIIGPRLTLWGWSRIKNRQTFGRLSVDRLAEAVTTLANADGGIPPVQLLLPGEDPDEIEPLLAVLMLYDLADAGKRGDRVWITSHAKAKLGLPV